MTKFVWKRGIAALVGVGCAILMALSATPAAARPWKSTPAMLAQDYTQIIDSRPNHQIVMVWWIPSLIEQSSESRDILDKYVVVGIVDAQVSDLGIFTFTPVQTLSVNADGKPLHLLTAADTPPGVASFLTFMQSAMTRAVGQVGAGLHWFAFSAGTFRPCGSGQLSIPYAGEVYTYDAPIPGCPKS